MVLVPVRKTLEDLKGQIFKARIIEHPKIQGDCVEVHLKNSSAGKQYRKFDLHVMLNEEHVMLFGLMESQINVLSNEWGEETANWLGNWIEYEVQQNASGYWNYVIKPINHQDKEVEV